MFSTLLFLAVLVGFVMVLVRGQHWQRQYVLTGLGAIAAVGVFALVLAAVG